MRTTDYGKGIRENDGEFYIQSECDSSGISGYGNRLLLKEERDADRGPINLTFR